VVTICSRKHWLWRAIDQDGYVLDEIVQMQGFRSPGGLQRFAAIFSNRRNHFVPPRQKRSAFQIHLHRLIAMAEWKAMAGIN